MIDFKKYITSVPDFPKPGILFRDISPTLENPEAFKECIDEMAKLTEKYEFDKIICADARGFIFGAAIAYVTGKGLVLARKPGKLSRPGATCRYSLEYGENMLQVSQGSIAEGEKVLLVDDLLATGGSALAMANLVKYAGGVPVASVFYVTLNECNGVEKLESARVKVETLITY